MADWKDQHDPYPAQLEERLEDGVVRCHLSPRNCRIRPGQHGFCMVRANRDGRLVSLNYGRSVHATEESIETHIYHYAPGTRILAMGNMGCMLNCDYCHNWKTSQARFVEEKDVHVYTPEQVIDIAKRHGIRVLTWTYNDPVVWHEFVTETSALARQAGIVTLFKSSLFITMEALEELLPVIDIFSISIKSMNPAVYRRLTKGRLEPVLEATKRVYQAGKHMEMSVLMVTDTTDDEDTARAVANFVGNELGPEVPTHYERFHPDYKMANTIRTPIDRLMRAREIAREMGLHHVYVDNVYDTDATNTWCRYCGCLQVERFGLSARQVGVTPDNRCAGCGQPTDIMRLNTPDPGRARVECLPGGERLEFASVKWHGDIRSLHIQVQNTGQDPQQVFERRFGENESGGWAVLPLLPGESYRFIASQAHPGEEGVEIAVPPGCQSSLHEVFDRAHFPTLDLDDQPFDAGDLLPFPRYEPQSRQ